MDVATFWPFRVENGRFESVFSPRSLVFLLLIWDQRRIQPGPTTGSNEETTRGRNRGPTAGSNNRERRSNNRERRSTHRSNRATGSSAREQRNNREPQLRITEKPKEKRSKGATGSDNREHRSTHRPTGTYGSIYPQTNRVTTNGSTEQPGVTDCQQAEPTTRGNGETAGATRQRNLREQQPKATDHLQEQQNNRGQQRTHPWAHRPTTHRPTKAKTGQEGIRDGATWRRRPRIFVRFFRPPAFSVTCGGPSGENAPTPPKERVRTRRSETGIV